MNTDPHAEAKRTAPLAQRVGMGAAALEVAAAVATVCGEIDAALRPVVGQRGVAALFLRSVKLTAAAHPWLVQLGQDAMTAFDPSTLKSLFEQQTPAMALSCGNQLLLNFDQLLASLIGAALTERLLRPVWDHSLSESPLPDTPS
jgi:hypothetical protein